jgi:molybdopterin-guanine dinucleotide biosynthesis protein A
VTTSRIATISAAVLSGGEAAADSPAGSGVADLLGELFEEVRSVDSSGLAGVAEALSQASGERVLVVAGDLPRLSADLVLALVAWPAADAVVPCTARGPQPLCALYRREPVLRAARQRLDSGELAVGGLLDAVETSLLDEDEVARVDPAILDG